MNHGDDYWWQPSRKVLVVQDSYGLRKGDVRTIAQSEENSIVLRDGSRSMCPKSFVRPIAFKGDTIPEGAGIYRVAIAMNRIAEGTIGKGWFPDGDGFTVVHDPQVIMSFPDVCPKCGKQDCRDGEQIGSIGGVKIVVDCAAEVVRCPAGVDERLLEAGS